ncbi:MAG: serine hydrolase domain-containing protein [Burkholderiales bacterium]
MKPPHSQPLPRADAESLGFSAPRLERLAMALRAEIAAGRLPGAVVAIARHGQLALFESFGYLDREAQEPMPTDAVFSIASMTKPLVAVGALTLYEEGRLMVNEPVANYLPQFANLRVLQHKTGEERSGPASRRMTVQDLMRHTAGLTYGNRGSTAFYKRYLSSSDVVAEQMTGAEFLQKLGELPLHFEPGTRWDYGFGFDVLGLLIEAITGETLGAFLEGRLFKPLGMIDTGFVVPPRSARRFAKGLPCDPLTGNPQPMRDSTRPHKFDCGGGCGVSTAGDYLRFAQMLLDGGVLDGVRILSRKTVDFMTADHIGPEIDAARLRDYPNINGYGFGLGVAVRRRAGGAIMSSAGEYHWAGSTGPYFWVDPSEGLVVVFMAHAPGALRFYYRQMLHALVLQALA